MIPKRRIPTHPGEILLEEFLRPLGITQVGFARHLGVPLQRINEIVRGKAPSRNNIVRSEAERRGGPRKERGGARALGTLTTSHDRRYPAKPGARSRMAPRGGPARHSPPPAEID